jgi:hypothetical protein
MAAIYSNGGNRWNILGFNFTKRDALSSVYKISMEESLGDNLNLYVYITLVLVAMHVVVAENIDKIFIENISKRKSSRRSIPRTNYINIFGFL